MSKGEGESFAGQLPRAVGLLPVCPSMKLVGKPGAGNRHARFDERGWETGRCRMAPATAPILDSTFAAAHRNASIRSLLEAKRTFREALLPLGATRMTPTGRKRVAFDAVHGPDLLYSICDP